jgi:hypothetical protein
VIGAGRRDVVKAKSSVWFQAYASSGISPEKKRCGSPAAELDGRRNTDDEQTRFATAANIVKGLYFACVLMKKALTMRASDDHTHIPRRLHTR